MTSEYPSMSSVLSFHEIFRNIKSDFSTTHSFWQQRKKPLDTVYPSVHLEIMVSLKSMGVGNVVVTFKLLRVWGILIHLLHWAGSISVPPPLYERFCSILVSTRLNMTIDYLGCLPSRVRWVRRFEYLGSAKHQSSRICWNVSSPHHTSRSSPEVVQMQGTKWINNSIWCAR